MGVKQVDCIKRTTQQMSVIMQNDKKRRKWALFFQDIIFFWGKSSTCVSCVWIDSPLDQHSGKIPLDVALSLSFARTLSRRQPHMQKRGFMMPGGACVRSAPSSSCSLPGWGSDEGRHPSLAARWSLQTETWPLRREEHKTRRWGIGTSRARW